MNIFKKFFEREVDAILGDFSSLVAELETRAASVKTQITDKEEQIANLVAQKEDHLKEHLKALAVARKINELIS